MESSQKSLFLILTVSFFLLLHACGGGSSSDSASSGNLVFRVVWDGDSNKDTAQQAIEAQNGDVCTAHGIETITAYIYNSSDTLDTSASFDCDAPNHSGEISDVSTGSNMYAVVEGEVSNQATWKGESERFTVRADQTTDAGLIELSYIGDDDVAPTVSMDPPADSAIADVATTIIATFSEAMNPSTLTADTFSINDGSSDIAGTVSADTTTATFTPTENLEHGKIYTVTITTDAKDQAGNALEADFESSFIIGWSFDDGTLQEWIADPPSVPEGDYANDVKWHVSDSRSASNPYAVRYADAATDNFDTGGFANTGGLMSPQLQLGPSPVLYFNYFLANECSTNGMVCPFDKLTVEISTDGGTTWDPPLVDLPVINTGFMGYSIDLSAYSNSNVHTRFYFDTIDAAANGYEGAYIDNVTLTPIPDLNVIISDVTWDGSNVTVGYTVNNYGSAAAGAFDVDVWPHLDSTPLIGDTGDGSQSYTGLLAGNSITDSIVIPSDLLSGTTYAIVDSGQSVTEVVAEHNNVGTGPSWSTVFPVAEFTVRDIPPDGTPDVFVGGNPPPKILFIKLTEDRAILEFDISSVSEDLKMATLDCTISTLDPSGASGEMSVYSFVANGIPELGDFNTAGKTLLQTFTGPNVSGNVSYSFSVFSPVRNVIQSGQSYIGFLFLIASGSDRYDMETTDVSFPADPHLKIYE